MSKPVESLAYHVPAKVSSRRSQIIGLLGGLAFTPISLGLMIWLVIIAGSFIAQGTGLFDEPTGPDPVDVEGALVLAGIERGLSITAECPDDAAETEIGGSFDCRVTTASGRSGTVRVTNNEDSYEYRVADLEALALGRR